MRMRGADFDRGSLWHYRATAVRVIDGDTFVAFVDTGFYGRHEARIRIAGLDTPERGEAGADEATQRLRGVVGGPPPHRDWPLRIVTLQRETSVTEVRSFERYVADVYVVGPDGELRDVKEMLR